MMKKLFLLLSLFIAQPAFADGWQILSLSASSEHEGSHVWSGKFTALNGRDYDASAFYSPRNQTLSAKIIMARPQQNRVTWLMPIALDGGYEARLYQAKPLFSFGLGAAIALSGDAMVSLRAENLMRLGGTISEQPCYDGFRRQYHCGTGLAWTDYSRLDDKRHDTLALPLFKVKFIKRFSF
jgi:hypothetical protein